jgi:hypothetical protein
MTCFISSHRLSVETGYQPVMNDPSYGDEAPPLWLITDWSTLPSTVPARTSG